MTALVSTFRGETLKLKRTLALWMVVLAPLVIIALQFALVASNVEFYAAENGVNPWLPFIQNIISIWAMLMLPLFITLETALLAQIEHRENHWKQLYVQPVPRWAHYAAKFGMGLLLVGLSCFTLIAGGVISGIVLKAIFPQLPFVWMNIPWGRITVFIGSVYATSWLIIAIHTWVANRWTSFNLAIGVGIAATVPNMLVLNSDVWAPRYPWAMPAVAFIAREGYVNLAPSAITIVIFAGLLGGVLVALITGWEFSQRDVL